MPVLRCRVLTPDGPAHTRYLDDALVVFDDTGHITDVCLPDGRQIDEDLRPGLLVPGFVDAHLHFPQTRIVGAASGPLLEWLRRSTYPEESRFSEDEHARAVAEIFCRNLAAAGTTFAMVYGSVHPGAAHHLLEAMARTGLRGIAGPVLMDAHCPDELTFPPDRAIPALEALAERWHGHDDRLRVAVIPRFALSCSKEMLERAGALSRSLGLWATTHLSESPAECAEARRLFEAEDYLRIYEDAGLLHEQSVFAHCIHLSASEWDRFAASGAVVAHCPDSNFFLGSGRMPIDEVTKRDIPLAIGSDIAAGRSFRIPRILSSTYDNALATGISLEPSRLFWWGTHGGAIALGEPNIGRIDPGCDADMALYDLPEWIEESDGALAWLLFDHDAPRPRRTWVRGREVWRREHGGYPWRDR